MISTGVVVGIAAICGWPFRPVHPARAERVVKVVMPPG